MSSNAHPGATQLPRQLPLEVCVACAEIIRGEREVHPGFADRFRRLTEGRRIHRVKAPPGAATTWRLCDLCVVYMPAFEPSRHFMAERV